MNRETDDETQRSASLSMVDAFLVLGLILLVFAFSMFDAEETDEQEFKQVLLSQMNGHAVFVSYDQKLFSLDDKKLDRPIQLSGLSKALHLRDVKDCLDKNFLPEESDHVALVDEISVDGLSVEWEGNNVSIVIDLINRDYPVYIGFAACCERQNDDGTPAHPIEGQILNTKLSNPFQAFQFRYDAKNIGCESLAADKRQKLIGAISSTPERVRFFEPNGSCGVAILEVK